MQLSGHQFEGVFISISRNSPLAAVHLGELHLSARLIDAKIQLRVTTKIPKFQIPAAVQSVFNFKHK